MIIHHWRFLFVYRWKLYRFTRFHLHISHICITSGLHSASNSSETPFLRSLTHFCTEHELKVRFRDCSAYITTQSFLIRLLGAKGVNYFICEFNMFHKERSHFRNLIDLVLTYFNRLIILIQQTYNFQNFTLL